MEYKILIAHHHETEFSDYAEQNIRKLGHLILM